MRSGEGGETYPNGDKYQVCVRACVCVREREREREREFVCVCVCACVCVCVCVHVLICVCVCTHINVCVCESVGFVGVRPEAGVRHNDLRKRVAVYRLLGQGRQMRRRCVANVLLMCC
jgi:hypothetical protein